MRFLCLGFWPRIIFPHDFYEGVSHGHWKIWNLCSPFLPLAAFCPERRNKLGRFDPIPAVWHVPDTPFWKARSRFSTADCRLGASAVAGSWSGSSFVWLALQSVSKTMTSRTSVKHHFNLNLDASASHSVSMAEAQMILNWNMQTTFWILNLFLVILTLDVFKSRDHSLPELTVLQSGSSQISKDMGSLILHFWIPLIPNWGRIWIPKWKITKQQLGPVADRRHFLLEFLASKIWDSSTTCLCCQRR